MKRNKKQGSFWQRAMRYASSIELQANALNRSLGSDRDVVYRDEVSWDNRDWK